MKRREIVTLQGGAMARCEDDVADLLSLRCVVERGSLVNDMDR
jgi:hypothetical protein